MFNKILSAVTAVAMTAAPSFARIDAGTRDLINTVDASDITVQIDSQYCIDNPGFHGVYRYHGFKRQLILCPGGEVDADDHNTVRHEVWHAIQHCVNVGRGTDLDYPVNDDHAQVVEDARTLLDPKYFQFIMNSYPEEVWLSEFEANIAAYLFDAEELEDMFKKVCLD